MVCSTGEAGLGQVATSTAMPYIGAMLLLAGVKLKCAKPATDEMKKCQDDLLASVKETKSGRAARTTQVVVTAASEARARTGLTQGEFAELLGVSVRTLQDWEQGRRDPTGAAQTLLRVAVKHPGILRALAVA